MTPQKPQMVGVFEASVGSYADFKVYGGTYRYWLYAEAATTIKSVGKRKPGFAMALAKKCAIKWEKISN